MNKDYRSIFTRKMNGKNDSESMSALNIKTAWKTDVWESHALESLKMHCQSDTHHYHQLSHH